MTILAQTYPFQPKRFTLNDGQQMSYVDQGQGEVVLLLHGNPTWSYFYRNLITTLSPNYRVIAPDHIGMGLSDKPQNYSYTLEQHRQNLDQLLAHLEIDKYSMVVHDWGGAIGFGSAVKRPNDLKKIIIMNTAAFLSPVIPMRINICRHKFFGEKLIRTFNGFAWPATFMAVKKTLPKEVKAGYLFPYSSYRNRIATARFVQDIPMSKDHPSYKTLEETQQKLSSLTGPKLILWGEKDFCFNHHFLDRWQQYYPDAKVCRFPTAGHYLIEDEKEKVCTEIKNFLDQN